MVYIHLIKTNMIIPFHCIVLICSKACDHCCIKVHNLNWNREAMDVQYSVL